MIHILSRNDLNFALWMYSTFKILKSSAFLILTEAERHRFPVGPLLPGDNIDLRIGLFFAQVYNCTAHVADFNGYEIMSLFLRVF